MGLLLEQGQVFELSFKHSKCSSCFLFTKQKQTLDLENKLGYWGIGEREGIVKEFGTTVCTLVRLKRTPKKTFCAAQGGLLIVMWQPGWEGSLWESGYMYMSG